jgi:hypothetical protein
VPHGRVLEHEVERQLSENKVFVQGCDHHGRPVIVLKGGNHVPRCALPSGGAAAAAPQPLGGPSGGRPRPHAPRPNPHAPRPHPSPHSPAAPSPRGNAEEVMRFYCYAADACLAIADPARNPQGHVVFILDVGDFGLRNFDLIGAKSVVTMIRVGGVGAGEGGRGGACPLP